MAIKTKSIQYALLPNTASVAAGVARPFPTLQIFIPETGSRVFKSCFVNVYINDAGASASPTSFRLQANITQSNIAGVLDVVGEGAAITSTCTTSGESQCWTISRDLTAIFTGSFGALSTSAYLNLSATVAVNATTMGSGKLTITYDYDDVAVTRIKTVRIPLQSPSGSIGTSSLIEVGQPNQVPALDTFLPEANKVYRDIFFEIEGNDQCNFVANTVLLASTDGINEFSCSGIFVNTLQSSRYYYYNAKVSGSIPTNATQKWLLRASGSNVAQGASTFDGISTVLHATYEYNHAASTTVINSLMFVSADDSGYMGGPIATSASRFDRAIIIQEPGPIQLVQSGIRYYFVGSAAIDFRPWVGTQVTRSFVIPARITCGGNAIATRIDSAGTQGAGFSSFTRGSNQLTVNWHRAGTALGTLGSNMCAILYLNYTSSISSQAGGDSNHSHTVFQHFMSHAPFLQQFSVYNWAPYIPSNLITNYWLMSYGLVLYNFIPGQSTTSAGNGFAVNAQILPNEDIGRGWRALYSTVIENDAEEGVQVNVVRAREDFKRFDDDYDSSRLHLAQSREMRVSSGIATFVNGFSFYTYHTINYQLSGSLSGYTGDGNGITVRFYNSASEECMLQTTSISGAFSHTWYDNTTPLYASAYQDSTHLGRSAPFTASGTP